MRYQVLLKTCYEGECLFFWWAAYDSLKDVECGWFHRREDAIDQCNIRETGKNSASSIQRAFYRHIEEFGEWGVWYIL
jgi:hypothetical protein